MPNASKHFPAACMAAALCLQGATAQSAGGCRISGGASSRVELQDAVSKAWVEIGEYACGEQAEELQVRDIDTQVATVARAFAEAIAEVTAACATTGNARASSSGTASAQARAVAYGEAISRVYADTEVCGKCTAAVDAISRTSRQLVEEAAAEAWVEISATSQAGESAEAQGRAIVHDIQETVAEVLAGVVGTIRSGADDGCSINVINEAQVGDYFARCDLDVHADSRVIEVDGIAEAAAAARSYACIVDQPGEDVNAADSMSIAQATAHALAEAVAQATVFCEANGGVDTRACGLAESDIEVVARAQAEAFAEGFASAETCGCEVSNYADTHVFEEIWVEAAAAAYAETCALGVDSSFVTDFQFALEERMLTATASAITSAISRASEHSDGCSIEIEVCGKTSECAANRRVCRGPGISGTLPCCNSDYHCVRLNDAESRCRRISAPVPAFYEGTIEAPTTCRLPTADDAADEE